MIEHKVCYITSRLTGDDSGYIGCKLAALHSTRSQLNQINRGNQMTIEETVYLKPVFGAIAV
jgi:hypothetical protein